jgi:HK97 gp10 family phage protein
MSINLQPGKLNPFFKMYLDKCTDNVLNEAKNLAPVDIGKLRDSIIKKDTENEFKKEIVSEADYSLYIELGTSKQAAQPFLRPALYNQLNYKG